MSLTSLKLRSVSCGTSAQVEGGLEGREERKEREKTTEAPNKREAKEERKGSGWTQGPERGNQQTKRHEQWSRRAMKICILPVG